MITAIAWKNVWRNRTRSFTVVAAVTVGVFAGVFSMAAINSSILQRIDAAVNEELSHIQVNNKAFRKSHDIQNVITDYPDVESVLKSTPGVTGVTGRVIVRGIASTATKSTGVEITGIDTDKEKQMFTLSTKLIPGTGSYFEENTKYNTAYIGEKLAKELNIIRYILTDESFSRLEGEGVPGTVCGKLGPLMGERFTSEKKFTKAFESLLEVQENEKYRWKILDAAWNYRQGSRLILSFLDTENNQTGAAFRISGIFRTNNDMFESTSLFVPVNELRRLTGMSEGTFHRVVARLENDDLTDDLSKEIRQKLPDYEVMNWKEIQPDLAMIADFIGQIYAVFMIIILAALAFGIVNTMMMSVLERTRELGMLMAVGMNRRRVFIMIMLESVFLSITGGFAGMAVSEVVIAITGKTGINLMK